MTYRVFPSLVMPTVRVLPVMLRVLVRAWVVGGGSGHGPSPLLEKGLVGVGGRSARRSWRRWLPLVSGQFLANPGGGCRW